MENDKQAHTNFP